MDIREYIESGVLELYAMGALPQEEARQVADAVARHPELRDELAEISRALEGIAPVRGKGPSAGLREKILASIPDDAGSSEAGSRPSGPVPGNVIPLNGSPAPSTSGGRRYLLAASFVGLLLSASAAVWFWSQWRTAEEDLAVANDVLERTATAYHQAEDELRTVRNYQNRMVRMTSTGNTPGALAVVYWNPESKEVFLDPARMPPLPDGKQYQLWAIADGDPVDAGVFDPATSGTMPGLQRMKNVTEVKVFAVTIEPTGGSETPTLETMTVSGQL